MRIGLTITGLCYLMLSGCTTGPTVVDIDGGDHKSRFTEGELVIDLHSPYLDSTQRRVGTLSLGYTQTTGQFHQTIDADEYIDLNGEQIYGPVKLHNEAELGVAYARYVRHMFRNEHFEWYWGAGAGYSNLDFTTTADGQQIKETSNAVGPHGLIGASYYFTPMFGVDTSASQYLLFLENASTLYELRGQFIFTPAESLRLYAGYRHWGYSLNPEEGESDIHFDFYGPTAGIMLRF